MATYRVGDKVILSSGRKATILYLENVTTGSNTHRVKTCAYASDRNIEISVYESSIKGLANSESVCVNREQIAKSIAMITRLTYAEALEDLKKDIKGMESSSSAAEIIFKAVQDGKRTFRDLGNDLNTYDCRTYGDC